jgi:hypothetical protein
MRKTILFLSILAACAQSGPPARGVPVTFESACDKANLGKRLMLEGFLDFPEHGFDDKATEIVMRLRPRLSGWSDTVGATARLGHGANNVEMPPETYKKTDLRLHLADGQVVTYWNKVKVSGTMFYATGQAPGAYTCAIGNTLFELGSGFQPKLPK